MAAISNIYYNLTAWASGPFAAGQFCSNAANAYRCITAGSSTAAPTGTGAAINNGGTAVFQWLSTLDYTSLPAWAAGIPSVLTQPVVAQIWNTGPITTTSGNAFLSLSGHTTSTSNTITIKPAPGQDFATALLANAALPLAFSSANGVSFVLPSTGVGGINYFLIQDTNVFLTGLQFQDPNATSGSTILQTTQTATVSGCIFDGYGQSGGAAIINPGLGGSSSSVFNLVNSLIVDRAPGGQTYAETILTNYNTQIANCTFVAINNPAASYFFLNQGGANTLTVNATNNIVLGYAPTYCFAGINPNAVNLQYNLFSANSVTGTGVVIGPGNLFSQSAASQFVASGTNFRLLPTASAIHAGTIDTADIPFATDILARSRSPVWDIGAYQYLDNNPSTATAQGMATVAGVSSVGSTAVASAAGTATVAGIANTELAAGTITAAAIVSGIPLQVSIGTASGAAAVVGYDLVSALQSIIDLQPIGTQVVGTPFPVTGTYTLFPELQFADDASGNFTPIPRSGVSPLGSTEFTFTHSGLATTGSYNLLVVDTSTSDAVATNYNVAATSAAANDSAFASGTISSLQTIIPAYIYQQYRDDDSITAFAQAYNNIAQTYLNWFNTINLPVYTGPLITGALLDWVAQGLYGVTRPVLANITTTSSGLINTYEFNTIEYDGSGVSSSGTYYVVTDDIYKRIITWSFYKGDGKTFNVRWLKRRIARFLAGVNGTDYTGPTDQISVQFIAQTTVSITLYTGAIELTYAPVLQAAIHSGVLPLPFQYSYNVIIST